MKMIIVTITAFLIFFITSVNAQVIKEKELSNVEKFSIQAGSLIIKEFHKIGDIENIQLDVITITDLLTNKKMRGLRLETEVSKSYGAASKSALLDEDEIDAFIKSINTIQNFIVEKVNGIETSIHPKDYTEIHFITRGGFTFGAFYDKSKFNWRIFLQLEKYDSDSEIFMDSKNMPKILNLIWDAKKYISPVK